MGHPHAFTVTLLALDTPVTVVGTYPLLPNPFARLASVGSLLPLALVVAWWSVYRDGSGRVQAFAESDGGGR